MSSNPFIGQIQPWGINFAPRAWAACDGQLLPISSNTALFSLLGTMYGGDGRTTMGLPDLKGRSMKHAGTGPGLPNYRQGQKGGANSRTLTTAQMPNHTHQIAISNEAGEESVANGKHIANDTNAFNEDATAGNNLAAPASVGGSQAFSIDNPYLGCIVCIALQGVYPSRS